MHRICSFCGNEFNRRGPKAVVAVGKYCSPKCFGAAKPSTDPAIRFWRHVQKTDGCWLWTGYVGRNGYGNIQIDHRPVLVHRFSYVMHFGTDPGAKVVRHTCDTRTCVRPDRLLLGTHADNSADMVARNRQASGMRNAAYVHPERRPRGEHHGNVKLSDAEVALIRSLYHGKWGEVTALATTFDVSLTCVSMIVRGLTRV